MCPVGFRQHQGKTNANGELATNWPFALVSQAKDNLSKLHPSATADGVHRKNFNSFDRNREADWLNPGWVVGLS